MSVAVYLSHPLKPRERLLQHGESALGISELIALIIGTGMHGVDVLDLAAAVRTQLISGNRSVHALAEIPGIGIRKAAAIVAALQLPDRLRQLEQGTKLTSPELLYQACSDFVLSFNAAQCFAARNREHWHCFCQFGAPTRCFSFGNLLQRFAYCPCAQPSFR